MYGLALTSTILYGLVLCLVWHSVVVLYGLVWCLVWHGVMVLYGLVWCVWSCTVLYDPVQFCFILYGPV